MTVVGPLLLRKGSHTMKVVGLLVIGLVLTTIVAALGTVFMWLGWNQGIVPALGFAHEIGFGQAFFVTLALSNVANVFKSSLTVNSKE
jgi:hypothetical protein